MPTGPKLKSADLIRDGNIDGKSQNPLFYSFVAELKDESKLVGYTISFFSYSTWEGKSFFLEDIYVRPDYRKLGIGKKLFTANVKFALEVDCVRFDFHVLNWNPAKTFYESLGAVNLTAKEGWEFFRLNCGEMKNLIGEINKN
jgi:diamine N-acetyltransferase